jgi:hypothetical protein
MTYAGVKFCKVGGKVITQAGGKVFELVKDGGKVLLKEGREELGKALTGPRLEPALAGPTARLPKTPNRDLLNVFFSKSAGKGGGGKPAPRPEVPKANIRKSPMTQEEKAVAYENIKSQLDRQFGPKTRLKVNGVGLIRKEIL